MRREVGMSDWVELDDHDLGRGPFPLIGEYGFLSDRETMALVAPDGSVEWLCLPRPDSPSVFGAILDRRAGSFRLAAAGQAVPAGRRYLPGTMVLETTWQTVTGWIVVRDALLVGPWNEDHRLEGYRRPPTDYLAEHVLLRTVRCMTGHVDVLMGCEPVFDYGATNGRWEYEEEGYLSAAVHGGSADPVLRLRTNLRIGFEGRSAQAYTTMQEGDDAFVALRWGRHECPDTLEEARDRLRRTANYWRRWLTQGQFPDHPWRSHLQRSALTLKGLTYAPTGALIAAPTTSLPESPGGGRNWDYRYTWVRDSTFALWALYTLGFDFEADSFLNFIADVAAEGDLQVMYGVGGERVLTERTLDHLTGYRGSLPVRVGNDAYSQVQLDVWGALLDSVWLHARSKEYLPERIWGVVERQVDDAIAHWQEPDRGIWEIRGEPRHFTSSKIMCWVACDRGARLADKLGRADLAARWGREAERIQADVLAKGVDERGVLTQSYGSKALDASLLLAPLFRFLPHDDERLRATVLAIADELTVDDLVMRYRPEDTDDGLEGTEGTFTICSFWLVSALAEIGEVHRANHLLEKLLSYASPLGLFAEELDARNGRHLGNFPQAFTHLALINAVLHIIRAQGGDEAMELGSLRPLTA